MDENTQACFRRRERLATHAPAGFHRGRRSRISHHRFDNDGSHSVKTTRHRGTHRLTFVLQRAIHEYKGKFAKLAPEGARFDLFCSCTFVDGLIGSGGRRDDCKLADVFDFGLLAQRFYGATGHIGFLLVADEVLDKGLRLGFIHRL